MFKLIVFSQELIDFTSRLFTATNVSEAASAVSAVFRASTGEAVFATPVKKTLAYMSSFVHAALSADSLPLNVILAVRDVVIGTSTYTLWATSSGDVDPITK